MLFPIPSSCSFTCGAGWGRYAHSTVFWANEEFLAQPGRIRWLTVSGPENAARIFHFGAGNNCELVFKHSPRVVLEGKNHDPELAAILLFYSFDGEAHHFYEFE